MRYPGTQGAAQRRPATKPDPVRGAFVVLLAATGQALPPDGRRSGGHHCEGGGKPP
ncbi:hypothetical protein ACIOJD_14345 [Streptomyces sp. NPDC088116]|uniref:hypothetical protein n=1 Tax=Streptomyces sp. NPDC088116 TaxID=3365825 RepID=UPI0037F32CE4